VLSTHLRDGKPMTVIAKRDAIFCPVVAPSDFAVSCDEPEALKPLHHPIVSALPTVPLEHLPAELLVGVGI
jgi:hypothetical protein